LHAAVGYVFKIVGCSAATEPGGFDGRKLHPVTALCAGEHEARQAGWRNALAVHGTNSVPVPLDPSRDRLTEESMNICAPNKILPVGLLVRCVRVDSACGLTKGQHQHGRAISRHRARRPAVRGHLRAPAQESSTLGRAIAPASRSAASGPASASPPCLLRPPLLSSRPLRASSCAICLVAAPSPLRRPFRPASRRGRCVGHGKARLGRTAAIFHLVSTPSV
jgi:hypothetical protein